MSNIILSPAHKAWITRRLQNPERFGELTKEQKENFKLLKKKKPKKQTEKKKKVSLN